MDRTESYGGWHRMHLGFTGTQQGLTEAQKRELWRWFIAGDTLHHGDCIGADKGAWELARAIGLRTVCHPPISKAKRAFTSPNDEVREPKEYLERNHDIVDESTMLVACPKGYAEEWRGSGTWATIRYAMAPKLQRLVIIIWPDGVIGKNSKIRSEAIAAALISRQQLVR